MEQRDSTAARLGLVATGAALLMSPIPRHRTVWRVTVGDRPPKNRVLRGGESLPSARVAFDAIRTGNRRPDAEFRSAIGLALIGLGLLVSLVAAQS